MSILPDKYIPTTLPGSRAPHVYLIHNGKKISILDLFEKDFILLIGSDGEPWRFAANQLAETMSLPLTAYKIAPDGDLIDPENTWHDIYSISTNCAVLVRPDGHVAWRSKSMVGDPKTELRKCLDTILG